MDEQPETQRDDEYLDWLLHRHLLDSIASALYYGLLCAAVVALATALFGMNPAAVTGVSLLVGMIAATATLQSRANASREDVERRIGDQD